MTEEISSGVILELLLKASNVLDFLRRYNFQIAFQSVASARETRISKKGRRGAEHVSSSVNEKAVRGSHETCSCSFVMVFTICGKGSGIALDLVKLFGGKSSVIRKRNEWDQYEPIVDLLSNEEVENLDAREERNALNMHKSQTESETEIRIMSLIPFLIRGGIRDGIRNGHFPSLIPVLISNGIRNGLSCIPSLIRL
ncbi:hypothetical protein Syun_009336 [Stephania yunnanensis]|uniref:Uncharacterized protein n=1 Tax=Stephania yunnanensis TaxID=152371 RepID=A0AAP0PNY4_9MAGN